MALNSQLIVLSGVVSPGKSKILSSSLLYNISLRCKFDIRFHSNETQAGNICRANSHARPFPLEAGSGKTLHVSRRICRASQKPILPPLSSCWPHVLLSLCCLLAEAPSGTVREHDPCIFFVPCMHQLEILYLYKCYLSFSTQPSSLIETRTVREIHPLGYQFLSALYLLLVTGTELLILRQGSHPSTVAAPIECDFSWHPSHPPTRARAEPSKSMQCANQQRCCSFAKGG